MPAADLLAFLAPEFADTPADLVTTALALAEPYRPKCLDAARGDEAVALYAAWLLSVRGPGAVAGGGLPGALLSEKEGDLARTYADPTANAAQLGNYRARYDALAKLCRSGAILTRFATVPVVADVDATGDDPRNWVWPPP